MPVQNVNLSGPLTSQFDLGAEQAKIARLRMIAQALMAKSQQSTSPVVDTGMYKIPNWSDPINKAINAYSARQQMDAADNEESGLNAKVQQRTQEALKTYKELSTGKPGTPDKYHYTDSQDVGEPTDWNASMLPRREAGTPGVAPDRRAAALSLVASGLPGLAQRGEKESEALDKAIPTFADLVKNGHFYDPKTYSKATDLAQKGDLVGAAALLQGRPTATVSDGVAATIQDGNVTGKTPINTYQPPERVDGVFGQYQNDTGKFEGRTGGAIDPNVAAENALSADLGHGKAAQIIKGQDTVNSNLKNAPLAAAAYTLADKAYTGAGADQQLMAAKIAKAVGLNPNDPRIADSETMKSIVYGRLLSAAKDHALGSSNSFSDGDRNFLKDVTVSSMSADPETAKRVAAIQMAGMLNDAEIHRRNIESAQSFGPAAYQKAQAFAVNNADYPILPGMKIAQDDAGLFRTDTIPGADGKAPGTPGAATQGKPRPPLDLSKYQIGRGQ